MRSEVITGEDGTDRRYPRGSENPYRYVSYRTAGGSCVQNREIESENLHEKVIQKVTKVEKRLKEVNKILTITVSRCIIQVRKRNLNQRRRQEQWLI